MAKLNKELIAQYVPPGTKIESRFPFKGYSIKTRAGSTMIVTERECRDVRGGQELYDAAVRLGAALGWPDIITRGTIEHNAQVLLAVQSAGLDLPVEAGETKRFFGMISDPPAALPRASGVHGTAGISRTDAAYAAAGLLGVPWGQGIPIGTSAESGRDTILRHAGENHLCCFGPPSSGKFTDLQSRTILECAATHSQFIIDASGGQIASALIGELRKHARVKVFYAFADLLPHGLPELLGPPASYNAMDLLKPKSSAYGVQSDALAKIVQPDMGGSDGFFVPSAREVTSGVIMHVKEFGRPEEQNLATVANIIRQRKVFAFARSVMNDPNAQKYAKERLAPYSELAAEHDRTINSILKTANLGLSFLSNAAISRLVRISSLCFEELKHGPKPTVVIVTMPTRMLHDCRNWFGLLLGSGLQELNSTPRGRWPVLVTVDEAGLIPPQHELIQCYLESRKRGVQVCTYWQDIKQPEIYGKNALQHFEAGSDVVLYLGAADMDTARHVSERAGRGSVIVPHFSYGAGRQGGAKPSVSFNEQAKDALTPQQVMGLSRNLAVTFLRGKSNAFITGRWPWFAYPELRARIAPDIFHRGKTS